MDIKEKQPIRDKAHIVLYGPDGKIKEERIVTPITSDFLNAIKTQEGKDVKQE